MQQINRTLYITEEQAELHLHNGALELEFPAASAVHIPLHNLDQIITFSYSPATTSVFTECAKRGIPVTVLFPNGSFRFRVTGETRGNVMVRVNQILRYADEERCLMASKTIIQSKIQNTAKLLRLQSHKSPNITLFRNTAAQIEEYASGLNSAVSIDTVRGIEGAASKLWFSIFSRILLSSVPDFSFTGRKQHPSTDPVNALLSYAYSILASTYIHALESHGLDPYVGFMHGIRSGKPSLALDLMEETRCVADRLVIRLINLSIVNSNMFTNEDDGSVVLTVDGRKVFFKEWEKMRHREVACYTGEVIPFGLLPYVQAGQIHDIVLGNSDSFEPFKLT